MDYIWWCREHWGLGKEGGKRTKNCAGIWVLILVTIYGLKANNFGFIYHF